MKIIKIILEFLTISWNKWWIYCHLELAQALSDQIFSCLWNRNIKLNPHCSNVHMAYIYLSSLHDIQRHRTILQFIQSPLNKYLRFTLKLAKHDYRLKCQCKFSNMKLCVYHFHDKFKITIDKLKILVMTKLLLISAK